LARRKAWARAFKAGITALVAASAAKGGDEATHLKTVFTHFFEDDEVKEELARLLRGRHIDPQVLEERFNHILDAHTLHDIPVHYAIEVFLGAFAQAAMLETDLESTLILGELVKQTGLQKEMLHSLQDLAAVMGKIREDTFELRNGVLRVIDEGGKTHQFEVGPPSTGGLELDLYLRTVIEKCDVLDLTPLDATAVSTSTPGTDGSLRLSDVFTRLYL
jgi:hypothetical protein